MPLMYPVKHVFRNWKLFTALLIGITLASTFCAAIGVKANLSAEEALDMQIGDIITDIQFSANLNRTDLDLALGNITSLQGVTDVNMVARFSLPVSMPSENYSRARYTQLTSFPNTSRIYDEWENKPLDGIPENYTYILSNSQLAREMKIGDNITAMLEFPTPKYWNSSSVYVNLTVAGYATLTDTGYTLVSSSGSPIIYSSGISRINGVQVYSTPSSGYRGELMIISWENTLEKLWNSTLDSSTVDMAFTVNVDRKNLISPWNVPASIQNINIIADNIQNEILANYLAQGYVTNILSSQLSGFNTNFQQTLQSYIYISIPVFFVAFYLGLTVSDVSFNIRRREIGLLSTKGLSSGQIQRMFLSEALIIGLLGGLLGVVGGLILNQYYAGTVDLNNLFAAQMFSPSIMIVTVVFGMLLSLFAVFWPSRKASKMPAVEALRDYMPLEGKSRWRIIPWIALVLGTYKIVVFALGLNISRLVNDAMYVRGDIFLRFFSDFILSFDAIMTIFGPFLFFWGFTMVVVRDSTKFQTAATKISSVLGDLGALAAKNVRRNPARLAAIAFMIAFIIGYSVQVNGQIASQQDFSYREVQAEIGADLTVQLVNASKAPIIFENIMANVSGIRNASIERSLQADLNEATGRISVKTIDVDTWGAAAYYEPGWFSGTSVDQMLTEMKANNNTIILDRSIAKQMNKNLYDEIAIDFDSCARKLRIIGFYGIEPPDTQTQVSIGISGYKPPVYVSSSFPSYVPTDLFNMTYGSGIHTVERFGTVVLIELNPGVNATDVSNQIRSLAPTEIYGVNSFEEEWQRSTEKNSLITFSSMQILEIQGLGLVFAVLSASVGTALIAVVSLKERSREATLMSVRGLSYRQLVWMFLTESMAVITFSVILGIIVGAIIVYGNVASANVSLSSYSLVAMRLVYPADALATIGTYVGLIYASTVGAILVMTSQYVTKLEKMVRAR